MCDRGVGEGEVLVATVGQAAHWFVCIYNFYNFYIIYL